MTVSCAGAGGGLTPPAPVPQKNGVCESIVTATAGADLKNDMKRFIFYASNKPLPCGDSLSPRKRLNTFRRKMTHCNFREFSVLIFGGTIT